jgi:hypothetical protein
MTDFPPVLAVSYPHRGRICLKPVAVSIDENTCDIKENIFDTWWGILIAAVQAFHPKRTPCKVVKNGTALGMILQKIVNTFHIRGRAYELIWKCENQIIPIAGGKRP